MSEARGARGFGISPGNGPRGGGGGGAGFTGTRALENMIPGLGLMTPLLALLSQFLQPFNIDVSFLISVLLVNAGLIGVFNYVWNNIVARFITCSVTINSDDDVYEHVMVWLAGQRVTENSRRLMIKTKKAGEQSPWAGRGKWGPPPPEHEEQVAPRYEPAYGSHRFWYQGRYFILRRAMKPDYNEQQRNRNEVSDQESITLTSISWSTRAVKSLIFTASDEYRKQRSSHTSIRVPSSSMHNTWKKLSTIPSRPIETLSLPTKHKENLIQDLTRFLRPEEQEWYRRRGIPYRRGYLFYGPPGTGKTSLAHVLAGKFSLDIFVINLLEPTLTEYKLTALFQNMPARCIVLLEDIDSAGLERRASSSKAMIGGKRGRGEEEVTSSGISLSCILNVIDGLVAHEGRVLFMTTNYPERLDAALVRPGRVDVKLPLELATTQQMEELFIKMYTEEEDDEAQAKKLKAYAQQFASLLPERAFAPADIQGYLLIHRNLPEQAIKDAEAWRDETLAEKAKALEDNTQGKTELEKKTEEPAQVNGDITHNENMQEKKENFLDETENRREGLRERRGRGRQHT